MKRRYFTRVDGRGMSDLDWALQIAPTAVSLWIVRQRRGAIIKSPQNPSLTYLGWTHGRGRGDISSETRAQRN
jgi:hypothetical protein